MKKGDEKMEYKDLWLVLGLTVLLAVTVTLSTVSLTGNVVSKPIVTKQVPVTSIREF